MIRLPHNMRLSLNKAASQDDAASLLLMDDKAASIDEAASKDKAPEEGEDSLQDDGSFLTFRFLTR